MSCVCVCVYVANARRQERRRRMRRRILWAARGLPDSWGRLCVCATTNVRIPERGGARGRGGGRGGNETLPWSNDLEEYVVTIGLICF